MLDKDGEPVQPYRMAYRPFLLLPQAVSLDVGRLRARLFAITGDPSCRLGPDAVALGSWNDAHLPKHLPLPADPVVVEGPVAAPEGLVLPVSGLTSLCAFFGAKELPSVFLCRDRSRIPLWHPAVIDDFRIALFRWEEEAAQASWLPIETVRLWRGKGR